MTPTYLRSQALSDGHVLVYHERQKLLAASAENDLLRKASHSQARPKSPSKLPRARSPDPLHHGRPGSSPPLEQQAALLTQTQCLVDAIMGSESGQGSTAATAATEQLLIDEVLSRGHTEAMQASSHRLWQCLAVIC